MNQFQSIESGQGILKNDYIPDQNPVYQALKMRRKKKATLETEPIVAQENNDDTFYKKNV